MQAAGRAFKLETAIAFGIKALRFGGCACHQLDLRFIERVDQCHEARRLVAVFRAERGNA